MIGAILGDIIGSQFEFSPLRYNKSEDFELLTTTSRITDDTIMTVATADAILNNKDFALTYQEWGRRYPNASYGGMFLQWLHSDNPKPYNSFGNGSAMRVSPIGWLYNDIEEVLRVATESAIVTHNHIEGIKGAQAVAGSIYLARNKIPKESIKQILEQAYGYDLSRTLEEIRTNYDIDLTCQGSVPEAIICFLEGTSYEDVVRKAVSLGGDTDTQACIAGSIAEAYYDVPRELVRVLENLPKDIKEIVNQFNKRVEKHL